MGFDPEGAPPGPDGFARALRAAISASGLSLSRIRQRLHLRGVDVSAATLSYWQSGRSRPTRARSRELLRHLAEVLGGDLLPPPPPPDGRVPHEVLWHRPDVVSALIARLGGTADPVLTQLRQHDRMTVGPDGRERAMWSRQVLRAGGDRATRLLLIHQAETPGSPPPTVSAVRGCRPGRVVSDPGTGHTVAELLFERPLRRGESVITEHRMEFHPPFPPATYFERKFRLPVREYVQEVRFHPDAVPAHCYQQVSDSATGSPHRVRGLRIDASHSVHAVALDVRPGVFGIQWAWEA
ncbi:hypothetical protein [Longispora urticae]